MKKLTGPITGLHFLRNNSFVTDTTDGLIHFSPLTMQVKLPQVEELQNPNLFSLTMPSRYHQGQQKQSQLLLTIFQNGTQQVL